MKKLQAQPLSEATFRKYGTYCDLIHPAGVKFDVDTGIEFYRDIDFLDLGVETTAAYSIGRIHERPLIIKAMECVNHTSKSFMPIDNDAILFFAPASSKDVLPIDGIEAFIVPKGTIVNIRAGVWHMAPYAYRCDIVNVLIVGTERFYVNDTDFHNLPEEQWIEITV